MDDLLTEYGITITAEDSELARRLKAKLKAELAAFESERQARQQIHDEGMQVVQRTREHYRESQYRRTADRITSDDLSDQAVQSASAILQSVTDDEMTKLFGAKSNATYAGKFAAKNKLAYAALRELARAKGLIIK